MSPCWTEQILNLTKIRVGYIRKWRHCFDYEQDKMSEPEDDVSEREEVPECTMAAPTIQAIDVGSVHRICSGQVVLTLATAVKELVENSIDAGATTVEIKLKEYGGESIEVNDNGVGVEEANFEGLTLKHHTSKLADFDDLVNVSTFGFRGEALSSLCALSNMCIVTRHKSAHVGTKLEFDLNGKIVGKKSTSRQIGTTVTIENIFHTLPVRHKEFGRNVKKEFSRLVQVLNAYCLINTNVRITCTNVTAKGSRSTIVSTSGNPTVKENIANVFGPKQMSSLLEFCQRPPDESVCLDFGLKLNQLQIDMFRLEGFVSKCEHGQGRSTTDRQFIFVNKRPCDVTKISKLINEVYHSYNRHQYPFVCLNISMRKDSVDVNVTPDKRQIFVEGERQLLAVIKASLIQLFEPTTSVYKMNNIFTPNTPNTPGTPVIKQSQDSYKDTPRPKPLSSISRFSNGFKDDNNDSPDSNDSLSKLKRSFGYAFAKESPESVKKSKSRPTTPGSLSRFAPDVGAITNFFSRTNSTSDSSEKNKSGEKREDKILSNTELDGREASCEEVKETNFYETVIHVNNSNQVVSEKEMDQVFVQPLEVDKEENTKYNENMDKGNSETSSDISIGNETESAELDFPKSTATKVTVIEVDEKEDIVNTKQKTVPFSMEFLRRKMKECKLDSDSSANHRSFRAKICPGDNQSAEEELQKEISKDMFSKMEILGQFNLGFIITKLGEDLFIIDQHASDEKYNFEQLQRHTVLQSQKMIIPQPLELTASNETILVDNIDVFKKNGFDFHIEPEAAPTQRVKLVSGPMSKNWSFGKDDIEELLFMLTDAPNVMCRPTRIRQMLASRSCRKSVMIGTALNKREMIRLVTHMGEIEQPWNCPHGRPTMRHLFNMDLLPS